MVALALEALLDRYGYEVAYPLPNRVLVTCKTCDEWGMGDGAQAMREAAEKACRRARCDACKALNSALRLGA